MKQQLMPPKGLKVGKVLYRVETGTYTDNKSYVDIQEIVVRSHRAKRGSKSKWGRASFGTGLTSKYYNLSVRREGVNWTKDGGWKATKSKDDLQFRDNIERLPKGLYTTIEKAFEWRIKELERQVIDWTADYEEALKSEDAEWIADEKEMLEDTKRELKAVKTRYTKHKNKKAK